MTHPLFIPVIMAAALFASSCSVSSGQLQGFRAAREGAGLQNYQWDATYDNVNYRLIAIEMPNGTLFADKSGNSLYFDGWSFSAVVGFGEYDGEVGVKGTDMASLEFNDDNAFALEKNCGDWQKTRTDEELIYTQSCGKGEKFTNRIYVNNMGEITRIMQHLEPSNKLMTLTKTNPTR